MLYFAYLDEFGHIGPYVARDDPAYNDSPVFGLGGMILPYSSVRQFSTWFYQLKCNMLAWEIGQSGQHPATWEKKGSALFTSMNVEKYRQVCGSAWKRDPGSGVIGVEKGPLIPVV